MRCPTRLSGRNGFCPIIFHSNLFFATRFYGLIKNFLKTPLTGVNQFGYFFAFSSKYVGLKMKQYYPNILFSGNSHYKKNLLKNVVFPMSPKLVSRAQKWLEFFFFFFFKFCRLKMKCYSINYFFVEKILRIEHPLETWQFSCTSHNLISKLLKWQKMNENCHFRHFCIL